ncbi:electron transfer flavoprotein subunit beta/FixA family protein [Sandaracinus amylolyticus]|uniref:electron transfer flavoprotein subunit beta/FixA family protein n=1 Tax=Sandaracinus amylolyticus TaxID=927083 RepID=UPI001F21677E|nr:electron transfer flavoprotein subunit beta/FixA family protein [Sandaracinus amylolyticus]UJR81825.1 Electron transfer flavoprotein small subunit [Sandaracinus amylolyticus]
MKILVPVKRVADPDNANKVKVSPDGQRVTSDGLEWKLNPFDEYAVEAALRINENGASGEKLGEVVVVSLGPDDVQTTLRQPLAMGADRGVQIKATDDQLDSSVVAKALKALVDAEKPDLVLMGKQAVDGDSNTAGQMLAELLGWPMATFAMAIEADASGKTLTVGREVDTGVLTLKVTLPAVVTVDLRIVSPAAVKNGKTPDTHKYNEGARYASLKGIMAAKKKPIDVKSLADLGVTSAPVVKYSKFELPPARSGQVKYVESVQELVTKLRTEAKVL